MTEIVVDADSALAGAINGNLNSTEDTLFLVLRNQDGKVLWSGDIHQWRFEFPTDKVHIRTRPVTDRIEMAATAARMKAEFELREHGLL